MRKEACDGVSRKWGARRVILTQLPGGNTVSAERGSYFPTRALVIWAPPIRLTWGPKPRAPPPSPGRSLASGRQPCILGRQCGHRPLYPLHLGSFPQDLGGLRPCGSAERAVMAPGQADRNALPTKEANLYRQMQKHYEVNHMQMECIEDFMHTPALLAAWSALDGLLARRGIGCRACTSRAAPLPC